MGGAGSGASAAAALFGVVAAKQKAARAKKPVIVSLLDSMEFNFVQQMEQNAVVYVAHSILIIVSVITYVAETSPEFASVKPAYWYDPVASSAVHPASFCARLASQRLFGPPRVDLAMGCCVGEQGVGRAVFLCPVHNRSCPAVLGPPAEQLCVLVRPSDLGGRCLHRALCRGFHHV